MARQIRYDAQTDYYDLLDLRSTATSTEIQRAFRQQAKRFHPDRNPTEAAKIQFQRISEAYHILSDEAVRLSYDLERRQLNPQLRSPNKNDDWWTRPQKAPKTPPTSPVYEAPPIYQAPTASANEAPYSNYRRMRNPYRVAFENIMQGPYRYWVYVAAIVVLVNVIFIVMVFGRPRPGAGSPVPTPSGYMLKQDQRDYRGDFGWLR
jgi:hypothetical protein